MCAEDISEKHTSGHWRKKLCRRPFDKMWGKAPEPFRQTDEYESHASHPHGCPWRKRLLKRRCVSAQVVGCQPQLISQWTVKVGVDYSTDRSIDGQGKSHGPACRQNQLPRTDSEERHA